MARYFDSMHMVNISTSAEKADVDCIIADLENVRFPCRALYINVKLSRCGEMGGCNRVLTVRRKFIEVSGSRTKTAETKAKSRSDKGFQTAYFNQNSKWKH
jgi:hypothetical protein